MNTYFKDWNEFNAEGATVPFYKKDSFIGFDSSSCTPPGPMVNATVALNFIKDKNTKVIMINHKFPAGLIPKIEQDYNYEKEELENGFVKIIFSLKDGKTPKTLDTNQICKG